MRLLILATLLSPCALAIQSQAPTTVALSVPTAELRETFTQIGSVRELSDGRLYVTDPRDKIVALVDFRSGTVQHVGRIGEGPGEFGLPQRVFAMRGDSTLLFDGQNQRFLVLLATGKPGATRVVDIPDVGAASIRFVDDGGRIYLTARPWGAAGDTRNDEMVVRYDPARKHLDTLARIGHPTGRVDGARTMPGGMLRLMNNKPYAKEDAVAFAPDGRVAIVRGGDYHVEWFGGPTRVTGTAISYRPIAINTAEKRAFLERMTTPGQITVSNPAAGGAVSAPMPPGALKPNADTYDDTGMEWPAQMPAFVGNAALATPNGNVWVLRTRAHDDSIPRYDVFDGAGRLTITVSLAKRARVVGFGTGTVYVAQRDEDDIEHLQRYRRP